MINVDYAAGLALEIAELRIRLLNAEVERDALRAERDQLKTQLLAEAAEAAAEQE